MEHLDRVSAHGREVLPAVAEADLAAGLDGDVLIGLHVLHQQVHQTQLVREADDEVEAGRVEPQSRREVCFSWVPKERCMYIYIYIHT